MRKLISIILISILVLAGCSNSSNQQREGKLKVATTVYSVYLLAQEIGGDNVEVSMLYPDNADIHSYEATAQDLEIMSNADVVFYISNEEEPFVESLEMVNADAKKVELATAIQSVVDAVEVFDEENSETQEGEEETTTESELADHAESHMWLSPLHAQKIAAVMYETYITVDEANKKSYDDNLVKTNIELQEASDLYTQFKKEQTNPIIVAHDAYGTIEEDYNIKYEALYGAHHDEEPSSQDIKDVIDEIKADSISTVYVEQNDLENSVIKQIAQETGAQVATLNNLSSNTASNEGKTLAQLLIENIEEMKKSQ